MPDTLTYPADHPLLSAFASAHGAVVQSPSAFARKVVKEHIKTQWGLDLDPDTTRIMTFRFSLVSGQPAYPATVLHSLTLTEAIMQRYQRHFHWYSGFGYVQPYKDGSVALQRVNELSKVYPVNVTEGIYAHSSPQVFNASTHINIRPDDFKRFVKDADLRSHYQAYLKTFWSAHASAYPVLAKAAFIKAACMQVQENSLTETDRQLVLRAVGLPFTQQWRALTPEQLQAPMVDDPQVIVAPLKIHRYTSTDILLIKEVVSGRVLLYIPGNSSPLHGFASEPAMAEWLAEQCLDPGKRQALALHFKDRDDDDGLFLSGLRTALEGVAAYPHWLNDVTGNWPPRHCIHAGRAISGDPFVFVRDSVEQRLRADAKSLLRSRGDARLEGITGVLYQSLLVTGLVALMVPEAIPFIMGLSITLIGTGTVQTVQGKTLEQRLAGWQRVQFGVLNALPLLAGKAIEGVAQAAATVDIVEPGVVPEESVSMIEQEAVRAESESNVRPRFDYEPPVLRSLSRPLRQSLRLFEAPRASVQGRPTVHGPNGMLDIHHSNGRYFLSIHDKAYEVHWEEIARRWQIVSPDEAGKAGPFVRQLESDQWDIDEGGLRGGIEPVSVTASGPSVTAQVRALYPGFSQQQVADFLAELRGNGASVEIQLSRLATEFQSLERSLERWVTGPLSWGPRLDSLSTPVSAAARRRAADVIKLCWQRQSPVEGIAARHIPGHMLNLAGIPMGDLPYLPGDFRHVTGINLSRTFSSHQSVSALLAKCPALRWLNAENNFLPVLPASLRGLTQLTRLTLAGNRIVLTAGMVDALGQLPNLRLLNLEFNPLGALLDVSAMPQLLNLFLRNAGLTALPRGITEATNLLALDLRGNLISTLPEAFYERPGLVRHALLDGNPLTPYSRGRLALMGAPALAQPQGDTVDFWLEHTPALNRVRRRDIWDLLQAQERSADFFEVIARQEGSADFDLGREAMTERVWQVLEAGAEDEALRNRLMAMAAHPNTCVDGAAVMFSNMELEVLVSRARALAGGGWQGPQLLKLIRGLFRLEQVDAIARLDAIARSDFTEDVEVMLAYRVGLASRLELPIGTRAMVYSDAASVSEEAIDRAGQTVLAREIPEDLAAFAVKRDFWVSYLEEEYAAQYALCREPTAQRMGALDDLQSTEPMTDMAYKVAAEAIMQQRREDEVELIKQLTIAELAGGTRANEV